MSSVVRSMSVCNPLLSATAASAAPREYIDASLVTWIHESDVVCPHRGVAASQVIGADHLICSQGVLVGR